MKTKALTSSPVRDQHKHTTVLLFSSNILTTDFYQPPHMCKIHSWEKSAGGGEVTHGLGLIGAAFGLAISVGPVLGGSLSEEHRSTACILAASMSMVAVLSLLFYGWEETSPAVHHVEETAATTTTVNSRGGGVRNCSSTGSPSPWRIVNPFLVLKVFLDSRCGRVFFLYRGGFRAIGEGGGGRRAEGIAKGFHAHACVC